VSRVFRTDKYEKVLVIWDKPKKNWDEIKENAVKQNIHILFLRNILNELLDELRTDNKNQRDEIIRTLQLVSRL
jgi:hypothetical protein